MWPPVFRDCGCARSVNRAAISPYVLMWAVDASGRLLGERVKWAPKPHTRHPVWNSARDMRVPQMSYAEMQRSLLHVEVWDYSGGLLPPNPVGELDVPLTTLLAADHIPISVVITPADAPGAEGALDATGGGGETGDEGKPAVRGGRIAAASVGNDGMMLLLKKGVYGVGELFLQEPPTPRPQPCSVLLRLVWLLRLQPLFRPHGIFAGRNHTCKVRCGRMVEGMLPSMQAHTREHTRACMRICVRTYAHKLARSMPFRSRNPRSFAA